MRSQRRLKIPRARLSNSVNQAVRREIEHTAKKFGVSKSFVQATALADFFGVNIEERYDEPRLKVVKGGKKRGHVSHLVHSSQPRKESSPAYSRMRR